MDHLAPNAPFNIEGFSAHSAIKNSVVQVARVSDTSVRSTESSAAEDSVSIKDAINVSAFGRLQCVRNYFALAIAFQ